jgi:hypothetical protein
MILKIRDWDTHFENSASRKLTRLSWVPVPNKTDGEGYTALVDNQNGAAHLGAWYAILEAASRQTPRERRGELPGGIPQDLGGICRSLGRISRLPPAIFSEVIPRLLEIGWLEKVAESADVLAESADVLADSADVLADSTKASAESAERIEQNRIELKGTEQNRIELKGTEQKDIEIGECVERIYALHPKKKNLALVPEALQSAVKKGASITDIETCHAAWCKTEDWTKGGGRFAPPLDQWLADRGYTQWPEGQRPKPPAPPIDYSRIIPFDPFNPRHHQNVDTPDVR